MNKKIFLLITMIFVVFSQAAFGITIGSFSKPSGLNTVLPNSIKCDGETIYDYHLQGFCTDGTYIYWSVTNKIIKTDMTGKLVNSTTILGTFGDHIGDIAYRDGKIYAPMALFSEIGQAASYSCGIQVYDASDLSLLAEETYTEDQNFSAIYVDRGKIFVGGGRGATETHEGKLFVYDQQTLAKLYEIELTGINFVIGIQSIGRYKNQWVLGQYETNAFNSSSVTVLNNDFTLYKTTNGTTEGFYFGGDTLGGYLYASSLSEGNNKAKIQKSNASSYANDPATVGITIGE